MIDYKINAGLQVMPHAEHVPLYPIIDEAIRVIQL